MSDKNSISPKGDMNDAVNAQVEAKRDIEQEIKDWEVEISNVVTEYDRLSKIPLDIETFHSHKLLRPSSSGSRWDFRLLRREIIQYAIALEQLRIDTGLERRLYPLEKRLATYEGFIARKLSSSMQDPVDRIASIFEEKSMWQKFGL